MTRGNEEIHCTVVPRHVHHVTCCGSRRDGYSICFRHGVGRQSLGDGETAPGTAVLYVEVQNVL